MYNSDPNKPSGEFGAYTLYERLGIGGMATVYRGVHKETGNEVALKRLLPQIAQDAQSIRQFIREAEIAQALSHPNIVQVVDFGRVEKEHFLAMEFIRGQSLLQLLRQANTHSQPAPVGVAVWVLHEVLSALDYAMTGLDENGDPFKIVHRDLSPSNIIMTPMGEIKIIDLGVAKGLQGRYATNSGRIKGKLGYMPPEVLTGRKIDQRSDLYSAAIVVWELLTARRLFRGDEKQQLDLRARNHEQTPPSSLNRWVPIELDRLLAVALSEDPDGRWESPGAMLDALGPIIASQGAAASTTTLTKWVRTIRIGKGVLDSSKTNHLMPNQNIGLETKPDAVIPGVSRSIPGVRVFPDVLHTVVDEYPVTSVTSVTSVQGEKVLTPTVTGLDSEEVEDEEGILLRWSQEPT